MEQLPVWFVATALSLLGAIWGSFVAALCHRWPLGESIIGGRSRCDHCKTALRAHELVPLLSYAVQKGRCRHCGKPIGIQAPAIELYAAIIGAVGALLVPVPQAMVIALFGWLTLPLILLDWRHYWLPDTLLFWLAIVGVLMGLLWPYPIELVDRLLGGVAGFAVLESIRRLYASLRKVDAMGAGDPKLFGAIGLWTGWLALPLILLAASLIGLVHFVLRGQSAVDVRFPFGSYLCLAALLWLLAQAILIENGLNLGIG
jgi:leader peptidase (prepilin peptidase) / N-methyltransferase